MVVWKTLCGNVCQDVSPLSRKRKHGSNLYSLQSGPPLLKENIGFQIIVRSCEQKKNCPAVEDPQGDLQNNCNQMGLNIIIVRVLEWEKSLPNHCSVVQAFIIQAFSVTACGAFSQRIRPRIIFSLCVCFCDIRDKSALFNILRQNAAIFDIGNG